LKDAEGCDHRRRARVFFMGAVTMIGAVTRLRDVSSVAYVA